MLNYSHFQTSLKKPKVFAVNNVNDQNEKCKDKEHVVEIGQEIGENDDLFLSLSRILKFGRLIGVVPITGLSGRTSQHLRFGWLNFPTFCNLIVDLILAVVVILGVIAFFQWEKRTAGAVALASALAVYYSVALFISTYICFNANRFIQLFSSWRNLKKLHFSNHKENKHDLQNMNLIGGTILMSAILENLFLFFIESGYLKSYQDSEPNSSVWEKYARNSRKEWALFLPNEGETYFALFVFVANKFAVYACNYADVLIILFARALYSKFKLLNMAAEDRLIVNGPNNNPREWKELTRDHATLRQLLSECDKFLSPMIFASYASNIFFICVQIKLGFTLSKNSNFAEGVYFVWSFLHLILRVFLMSLFGGRINDYSYGTLRLLQQCPSDAYSLEVQRAEDCLRTGVFGLTGLKCFVITKPFLLAFIGVVFTIEIVMLPD